MDDSTKAKCASCAGATGIAACTISMTLAAAGIAAVGFSGSGMAGMSSQSTNIALGSPLLQIVSFLTGFWGEVILLFSFGLMTFGMWSASQIRPMTLALIGAPILFVGMYAYFLIELQMAGIIILALAYATAFSHRAALATRMT